MPDPLGNIRHVIFQETQKEERPHGSPGSGANRRSRGLGLQNHVKQHFVVARVQIVPMCSPEAMFQVHFHITREKLSIHLELRTPEIRTFAPVPPTGRNDFQGRAVLRFERLAPKQLVVPDALHHILRNRVRTLTRNIGTLGTESRVGLGEQSFRS